MDSDRSGPDVHHPKWRRTPSPQAIAPAKPTTAREYHIWLKEQTLQLLELIQYGDELVEAGILKHSEQGRWELGNSALALIRVLNVNGIDISQFPRVDGVNDEVKW